MADYTLSAKVTADASNAQKSFEEIQKGLEKLEAKFESLGYAGKKAEKAIEEAGNKSASAAGDLGVLGEKADSASGKLGGVGDSATKAGKKTRRGAQDGADGMETLRRKLDAVQSKMQGISDTMGAVGKKMMLTGGVMTAGITVPIAAAGKSLIGYNAKMEQYTASFGIMMGDQARATQLVEKLKEQAAATPFEMQDLAETTQLLMNYGFTGDAVMDKLSMLGDISQGNGDKLNRVSMAYGQMSSYGKVTLVDIKQMIEAGFNPLREISDSTGESMTSLYDRISDGTLSVDEITASMQRSTSEGGLYFNSMEEQSKTLNGRISTLKDTFSETFGAALDGVNDVLRDKIIPSLTEFLQTVDPEVVIGFAAAIAAIGPVLTVVGGTLLGAKKAVDGISGMVGIFGKLVGVVSKLGGVAKILGGAFAAITSPIGLIIIAIGAVVATVTYLWNNCEWFRNGIIGVWESIKSAFLAAPAFFTGIWESVSSWAINAWNAIADSVASAWGSICTAASSAWQSICMFFAPAVAFFTQVWNAIASIVQLTFGIIVTIVRVGIAIVTALFQMIIYGAQVAWDGVCNLFAPAVAFFAGVWAGIVAGFSAMWSGIVSVFQVVWSIIVAKVTSIVGVFTSVFGAIWGVVQSVFGAIGNFIGSIFEGIQTAWTGLTGFVQGVFDGIFSAVQTLVDAVKGFVNCVISGINGAINLINMIPGVAIAPIPFLLHGTDNWQGGFARMNEGGRGELTYLPGGAQVIPHDISVQYAKEAARANAQPSFEPVIVQAEGDKFYFYEKLPTPSEHYRAVRKAKREVHA